MKTTKSTVIAAMRDTKVTEHKINNLIRKTCYNTETKNKIRNGKTI